MGARNKRHGRGGARLFSRGTGRRNIGAAPTAGTHSLIAPERAKSNEVMFMRGDGTTLETAPKIR